MTWRSAGAALALTMLVALPGGRLTAQDAPQANPPLATVPLTLVAHGRRYRYRVEVARTPAEQARGLMQRRTMARRRGMLFPMAPPREATFWMEGTILPLDIVFVTADHVVGRVAANAVPFDRTRIPSRGPVGAVLELNGGEAARIGLQPGDPVRYALGAGGEQR